MRTQARHALAVTAGLFLGGLVVQVFLAGVGLFEVASMDYHRGFGYLLPYLTLLLLLEAALARPGRRVGALVVGVFVLGGVIQPLLPAFKDTGLAWIAALHPPNALLVSWLSLVLARDATRLARLEQVKSPGGGPARAREGERLRS
jgi:hypothetical protein